ncbi:MAG: hypothetical protein GY883_04520 [Shimia sp.]|nr:hypothetical protein [Shimia sp.]
MHKHSKLRPMPVKVLVVTLGLLAFLAERPAAQEIKLNVLGNALEALMITIDGEFFPGIAQRTDALLSEDKSVYQVVLNSPGGDLMAGIELGHVLRRHGVHVSVGRIEEHIDQHGQKEHQWKQGRCDSACAIAFLGGEVRDVGSATKLGFHQFYGDASLASKNVINVEHLYQRTMSETQFIAGLLIQYIVEMGVDARIFSKASQAGAQELTHFTKTQAVDYNIVTPLGFGDWFIEPFKDGIIAASKRRGPTRAYDQVHQTTVYCSSEHSGVATIMLTAAGNEGYAERIRENLPNVTGTLFVSIPATDQETFEIPSDRVKIRGSGDDIWLDFQIHLPEMRALLNTTEFHLRLDAPRVAGGFYANHSVTDADRAMIRSALMHCI